MFARALGPLLAAMVLLAPIADAAPRRVAASATPSTKPKRWPYATRHVVASSIVLGDLAYRLATHGTGLAGVPGLELVADGAALVAGYALAEIPAHFGHLFHDEFGQYAKVPVNQAMFEENIAHHERPGAVAHESAFRSATLNAVSRGTTPIMVATAIGAHALGWGPLEAGALGMGTGMFLAPFSHKLAHTNLPRAFELASRWEKVGLGAAAIAQRLTLFMRNRDHMHEHHLDPSGGHGGFTAPSNALAERFDIAAKVRVKHFQATGEIPMSWTGPNGESLMLRELGPDAEKPHPVLLAEFGPRGPPPLGPPASRTQDQRISLSDDLETDRTLGKGFAKTAFAVRGRPDLVLLRMGQQGKQETRLARAYARVNGDEAAARREQAILEDLSAIGIPTAKIHDVGTYRGTPAVLMQRYAVGSRPAPGQALTLFEVLSEKTLADIALIRDRLARAPAHVLDMQFLLDKDGSVFVADPMYLRHAKTGGLPGLLYDTMSPHPDMHGALDELEARARYAVAVRSGAVPAPTSGDQFLRKARVLQRGLTDARKQHRAFVVEPEVASTLKPGAATIRLDHDRPSPLGVVLMLPGFSGTPAMWEPLARELHARGYDVEVAALPGHGLVRPDGTEDLSELPDSSRSAEYERFIEAKVEEVAKRNPKVHLVGFSFGGTLALHAATVLGDRTSAETGEPIIQGVNAVNPFLRTSPEHLKGRVFAQLEPLDRATRGRLGMLLDRKRSEPDTARRVNRGQTDALTGFRTPTVGHALALSQVAHRVATGARPPANLPIHLMLSKQDGVADPDASRAYVDANGAEMTELPATGHIPFAKADARKATYEAIIRSLAPRTRDPRPGIFGKPMGVHTLHSDELPYHEPPEVHVVQPGFMLAKLDRSRRYLWTIDQAGVYRVAPEDQPEMGRKVKHGDLNPGPDGRDRGVARNGGELAWDEERASWVLDNTSAFAGDRLDDKFTTQEALVAARDRLTRAAGVDAESVQVRDRFTYRSLRPLHYAVRHRLANQEAKRDGRKTQRELRLEAEAP